MKNRGKRYPKAFKRECVDYVRKNQDIPVSEAADNLGVPNYTLQRWVKQADIDDGISKSGALTSVEKLEFQHLRPLQKMISIIQSRYRHILPSSKSCSNYVTTSIIENGNRFCSRTRKMEILFCIGLTRYFGFNLSILFRSCPEFLPS